MCFGYKITHTHTHFFFAKNKSLPLFQMIAKADFTYLVIVCARIHTHTLNIHILHLFSDLHSFPGSTALRLWETSKKGPSVCISNQILYPSFREESLSCLQQHSVIPWLVLSLSSSIWLESCHFVTHWPHPFLRPVAFMESQIPVKKLQPGGGQTP